MEMTHTHMWVHLEMELNIVRSISECAWNADKPTGGTQSLTAGSIEPCCARELSGTLAETEWLRDKEGRAPEGRERDSEQRRESKL